MPAKVPTCGARAYLSGAARNIRPMGLRRPSPSKSLSIQLCRPHCSIPSGASLLERSCRDFTLGNNTKRYKSAVRSLAQRRTGRCYGFLSLVARTIGAPQWRLARSHGCHGAGFHPSGDIRFQPSHRILAELAAPGEFPVTFQTVNRHSREPGDLHHLANSKEFHVVSPAEHLALREGARERPLAIIRTPFGKVSGRKCSNSGRNSKLFVRS